MPTLWLDAFVFLAGVCGMKPLFSPKHTEDVIGFSFIAGDRWRKVGSLMKKWKRNDFVFLKTQILFFTD